MDFERQIEDVYGQATPLLNFGIVDKIVGKFSNNLLYYIYLYGILRNA